MIEVSVVICALNEEHRIRRQLNALDAQVEAPAFEVIVVDNGSTDRTAEVVRSWIARSRRLADDARLVDASSTPGIPAARNAGVRAASGRVIAFCDADDQVQPGWVAAMAQAVVDGVIAGGRVIAFEPSGELRGDLYGPGLTATPYLPYVGASNLGVSRSLYLKLGGMDESLPRYGFEDVDFSWRAQEAGYHLVHAPDAVVHFSLSDTSASVRKRFQLGQGRVLMARRFPRYDSTEYTLRSTSATLLGHGVALLHGLITTRSVDRRRAAAAVASAGNLVGALRYRGKNSLPPRRMLTEHEAPVDSGPAPTISIATNNGDVGGGEVMLLHLARSLREIGLQVQVIGPREPAGLLQAAREAGHRTVELPAASRPRYMLELARLRARHRKELLWCNGLVPSVATAGMGPRIVHLHMLPRGRQALAARMAGLGARAVLVPSQFVADRVAGARVFGNWTAQIAARPILNPSTESVRVGFLGRITVDKGVEVLARAIGQLPEPTRAGMTLVLAGESTFARDGEEQQIGAALRSAGVRIERRGWMRPEDFFAQVDLAVFPSVTPESFGLVVAEAMAAGTPFVITDAGALRETAGEDHPWVARAGDAEHLAAVIGEALRDIQCGDGPRARQARERWEEHWSPAAGLARTREQLISLDRLDPTQNRRTRR
ncbi:glycosyltransferase [Brachybacterium sp. UMB0905]|uniref:glycosyltransferase n=1 Tax=Brachybacterium sp. UMB0905 TaxID=2069310 RepID=UPI000C802F21|nr:glycosyltransferase [Brachybacterium sp. UMB0905]PMC74788.1 hypothetical protein CJ197_11740 [Brachybacterium sp. UMB0905]